MPHTDFNSVVDGRWNLVGGSAKLCRAARRRKERSEVVVVAFDLAI